MTSSFDWKAARQRAARSRAAPARSMPRVGPKPQIVPKPGGGKMIVNSHGTDEESSGSEPEWESDGNDDTFVPDKREVRQIKESDEQDDEEMSAEELEEIEARKRGSLWTTVEIDRGQKTGRPETFCRPEPCAAFLRGDKQRPKLTRRPQFKRAAVGGVKLRGDIAPSRSKPRKPGRPRTELATYVVHPKAPSSKAIPNAKKCKQSREKAGLLLARAAAIFLAYLRESQAVMKQMSNCISHGRPVPMETMTKLGEFAMFPGEELLTEMLPRSVRAPKEWTEYMDATFGKAKQGHSKSGVIGASLYKKYTAAGYIHTVDSLSHTAGYVDADTAAAAAAGAAELDLAFAKFDDFIDLP